MTKIVFDTSERKSIIAEAPFYFTYNDMRSGKTYAEFLGDICITVNVNEKVISHVDLTESHLLWDKKLRVLSLDNVQEVTKSDYLASKKVVAEELGLSLKENV